MTQPDPDRLAALLHLHTFGRLSDSERDELFTAAAEDPELYGQLMDAEDLRAALEDPAERRKLVQALPPGPRPASGLRWLALGWALGGVCAGLLVLVAIQHFAGSSVEVAKTDRRPPRTSPTPTPTPVPLPVQQGPSKTPSPVPDIVAAGIAASDPLRPVFELDPQRSLAVEASLPGLHQPTAPGSTVTLQLASPAASTAWVFLRRPSGPLVAITAPAGLPLDAGHPVTVAVPLGSLKGPHTVRVVALSQPARLYRDGHLDVSMISGLVAVVDRPIRVAER